MIDGTRSTADRKHWATTQGPGVVLPAIPYLAEWMAQHPGATDEDLSGVIEEFGRRCIAHGVPVDLQSFLDTIPGLASKPVALDAAIDMTLRSLSGTTRPTSEAVEVLLDNYPALRGPILASARLGLALWTTGRTETDSPAPATQKPLPRDFGPTLESGEPQYLLSAVLGEGASAWVYLAVDRKMSDGATEARVAIKVLKDASGLGGCYADEAIKARRVEHPNVVRALDRGLADDGSAYIVYEYIAGGDLASYVESRGGRLPAREAASLCARVARGVQSAHRAGLVHCDLKPANVLMSEGGEPKVADFGVSSRNDGWGANPEADRSSRRLGTPAFMAPEQGLDDPTGLAPPVDVYGIGGLLFWMLTGMPPNGETPREVEATLAGRTARDPEPILRARGLDRDLVSICSRALKTDPARRHASAESLAEDLESWLACRPVHWTRPGVLRKSWLWSRRHPAAAVLSLGLFVSILGGATIAWRLDQRARAVVARDAERTRLALMGLDQARLFSARGPEGAYLTQQLSLLWLLDWFFGPSVFDIPDRIEALWSDRIKIALRQASRADERSTVPTMEAMLWRTNAAFWLLGQGRWEEAAPIIERCRDYACERMDPRDPWAEILDGLAACAWVDMARSKGLSAVDAGRAGAARARVQLELALRGARATADIGPLRLAFLKRLEWLLSPEALNDPVHFNEVSAAIPGAEDTYPGKPR